MLCLRYYGAINHTNLIIALIALYLSIYNPLLVSTTLEKYENTTFFFLWVNDGFKKQCSFMLTTTKKVKQESYERKNYNQTTRQSGKVFKVIGFLKVKPRCEFKLFAVLF